MPKVKKSNSYQMTVDPKEEKIFRWVESDECLGSRVFGEDATVLEKTKYQFCQAITRYQIQNNLTEKKIANLLGLDKLSTAKLLRGYVENFALDSLISYVEKLNIPCQVKITSGSPRERELSSPVRKFNGRIRKTA